MLKRKKNADRGPGGPPRNGPGPVVGSLGVSRGVPAEDSWKSPVPGMSPEVNGELA